MKIIINNSIDRYINMATISCVKLTLLEYFGDVVSEIVIGLEDCSLSIQDMSLIPSMQQLENKNHTVIHVVDEVGLFVCSKIKVLDDTLVFSSVGPDTTEIVFDVQLAGDNLEYITEIIRFVDCINSYNRYKYQGNLNIELINHL
jgi:hypothetical protein